MFVLQTLAVQDAISSGRNAHVLYLSSLRSGQLGIEIEQFVSLTSAISTFVHVKSPIDGWAGCSHLGRGIWREVWQKYSHSLLKLKYG